MIKKISKKGIEFNPFGFLIDPQYIIVILILKRERIKDGLKQTTPLSVRSKGVVFKQKN